MTQRNSLKRCYWLLISALIVISACQKQKNDPEVKTTSLTNQTTSTFLAVGKVVEKGDFRITDHGFAYYLDYSSNTVINPSESSMTKVSLGSSITTDTFSATLKPSSFQSFFSSGLKFYVRAYVTNVKGTVYGNVMSVDIKRVSATNVYPSVAKPGDTISIFGQNFDTSPENNSVIFNYTSARIISVTSTRIMVLVPFGITIDSWNSYVTLHINSGGQSYDLSSVFQLAASATEFSPKKGNWNTEINIYGSNLSYATVFFDDVSVSSSNSSSNISVHVPTNIKSKSFRIFILSNGVKSEVPGGYFTMDNLTVDPIEQLKYFRNSRILIYGDGFNPFSYNDTLFIGTKAIPGQSMNSNSIYYNIPGNIPAGNYSLMVSNGIERIRLPETISIIIPKITGMSKSTGYPFSKMTITGENFFTSSDQTTSVRFGGIYTSVESIDSSNINITVPWITSGEYVVYASFDGTEFQCPTTFIIQEPKITSLTPSSGTAGTTVSIKGEGFGSDHVVSVYFGNLYANVLSSSDTAISVMAPAGIPTGQYAVKVYVHNNQLPSGAVFTVP